MQYNPSFLTKSMVLIILMLLCWVEHSNHLILQFLDQALLQSSLVYASSRSVNAAISLLQSGEVGIGIASIHPAQLLDPINDLAEYTSDAMRLAIGSLFIQRILYTISSGSLFSGIFTGAVIAYFVCVWRNYLPFLRDRIIYTFILIRFLIPAIVLTTGILSQVFLDAQIDQENRQVSDKVSTISNTATTTSRLSNELTNKLKSQKQTLLDKLNALGTQQVNIHQQVTTLKIEIKQLKQQVEKIQQQRSLTEKLTFTELAQAQPLKLKITKKQNQINSLKEQQRHLNEQKYRLNEQIETVNQQLLGDNTSQIQKAIDALTHGVNNMLERVEGLFNEFLNLLSLLILKLLIMPLVFFYLFSKVFKAIWQRSIIYNVVDAKEQLPHTEKTTRAL